jgi:hypothetical protein
MSRFFRAARFNLLEEGKTFAYLKYAVGEILLLVIGIFIALQVNNWNEARKQRAREGVALERLHAEAIKDVRYLSEAIAQGEERHQWQKTALAALSRGEWQQVDAAFSWDHALASLTTLPTLSPPRSVYDDLVSSGIFGELTNTDVRTAVAAYHSQLQHAQGQLAYVRTLVPEFRQARAESGVVKLNYDPTAERSIAVELDLPAMAGSRKFMDSAFAAWSNQQHLQLTRHEALARAQEMCDALAKAIDKPC